MPDSNPDPTLGNYAQTTAMSVQFSTGLSLIDRPFDYAVSSSRYNPNVDLTYDAISFYVYQPTMLGLQLRFTPGTFANDFALTPFHSSLTPDVVEWLGPTDRFVFENGRMIWGTIDSISVSSANVPDGAATSGLLLLPLAALAGSVAGTLSHGKEST